MDLNPAGKSNKTLWRHLFFLICVDSPFCTVLAHLEAVAINHFDHSDWSEWSKLWLLNLITNPIFKMLKSTFSVASEFASMVHENKENNKLFFTNFVKTVEWQASETRTKSKVMKMKFGCFYTLKIECIGVIRISELLTFQTYWFWLKASLFSYLMLISVIAEKFEFCFT